MKYGFCSVLGGKPPGEHVEKGSKSIALSIVFQSAQRTLKDADINEIHNRILETLEKDLHAQLRA